MLGINERESTSNTVINKNLKAELRKYVAPVKVSISEEDLEKGKFLDDLSAELKSGTILDRILNHDISKLQRYEYDYLEYRVYEVILSKRLYLEGIKFSVLRRQQKESTKVIKFIWDNSEYILMMLDVIKDRKFSKVKVSERCSNPKEVYQVYVDNEYEILDRVLDGERVVDILHDLGVPYIGREWIRFGDYVKSMDLKVLGN